MTDQQAGATRPALARELGTFDAVVIGLSAMIGAGVFSAFAPAADSAGSGLLIGLGIAAVVAYCNAVSSAQLAAQYPTSGGTYVYGRQRLGQWWGFIAGWGFVVGKTASCAAMALTFAAYSVDGAEWVQRLVALAALLLLTTVNYHGITKTSGLARALVALTLGALATAVVVVLVGHGSSPSRIGDDGGWSTGSWYGVFQSAGLLFFAFDGYARIATLGEEVREPRRTIPRHPDRARHHGNGVRRVGRDHARCRRPGCYRQQRDSPVHHGQRRWSRLGCLGRTRRCHRSQPWCLARARCRGWSHGPRYGPAR